MSGRWGDELTESTLRSDYRDIRRGSYSRCWLSRCTCGWWPGGPPGSNSVTLLEPLWLLLAVPLFAVLLRYPLPGRLPNGLRGDASSRFWRWPSAAIRFPSRAGTVVVVVDRSRSMPAGSDADYKELIDLLHASMGSNDQLAVVSFGQTVAVGQRSRATSSPASPTKSARTAPR